MLNNKALKFLALFLFVASHFWSQDNLLFKRDFDTNLKTDKTIGYLTYEKGVIGNAANLDGLSSYIEIPAKALNDLNENFTLEAWVALQEYPWNWAGILDNRKGGNGIFFGIGAYGELGLFINNDYKEIKCISDSTVAIPHLQWSHVAASFSKESGIKIYIDGKLVGFNPYNENYTIDSGSNIWIGRSKVDTCARDTERENSIKNKSKMILDGLLDELKVHNKSMTESEIFDLFKKTEPSVKKV
ncbi:MAG: LamG domain-containing protein, partial [Melioribacteraceae bacterium]|nr:LamG domain-containing protein [Melioribacteraceae bacterium]